MGQAPAINGPVSLRDFRSVDQVSKTAFEETKEAIGICRKITRRSEFPGCCFLWISNLQGSTQPGKNGKGKNAH